MLQRLANMNANKPFLTQRNTEALAHDQPCPHPHANIAVAAAVKCKALRAGQFGKKPCLVGSRGIAALPLAALCAATRLPDRCRHVCKTCESMLMTQTVGGCTRKSAIGKVHGDSGDAKLPKCRHFWTRWSTQRVTSIAMFLDGVIGASFGKHAALTCRQPQATAARTHSLVDNFSTHSAESYVNATADTRYQWPASSVLSDLMCS